MKIASLDDLVHRLCEVRAGYEDYIKILRETDFNAIDLHPYIFFRHGRYTRNLVCKTDRFELMLLCWEEGQRTPIHDHSNSEGIMVCTEGQVKEERYLLSENGDRYQLIKEQETSASPYMICHVNDELGVHEIINTHPGRSITVHLYNPPIKECRYFDPISGKSCVKKMSYFSIHGKEVES